MDPPRGITQIRGRLCSYNGYEKVDKSRVSAVGLLKYHYKYAYYDCERYKWVIYCSVDVCNYHIAPFNRPGNLTEYISHLNDDHMMRDVIKQEMLDKKDLLLKALETNQVKILPRLQGKAKILSCKRCPFYSQCYDTDTETIDAITLRAQKDPLVANQGYLNVTKESN
jgi:hypothetical protein